MPNRPGRGTAGVPFHVLNRGACRQVLFEDDIDYRAFLACTAGAMRRIPVSLLAYCLMPNHFHLVVQPAEDGQLSVFMKFLEAKHSKRWHARRKTTGSGAVYQGRFKAFPIQTDRHFYAVCRYVERNALRGGLVPRAEDWPWGSLAQRCQKMHGLRLSTWPIVQPDQWVQLVNEGEVKESLDAVRQSVATSRPFGDSDWTTKAATDMGLSAKLRPRGRPRTKKTSGIFSNEKDSRRLFDL